MDLTAGEMMFQQYVYIHQKFVKSVYIEIDLHGWQHDTEGTVTRSLKIVM